MNHILIVDDQPENLKVIANFFIKSKQSYRITKAPNGEVAINLIKKNCPDIIISDWDMPVMDGIEFIKQLKTIDCAAEIPVIMCTGVMTSSENLQTALEAGAFDYIQKPIDEIELEARVNSAIRYAKILVDNKKRLKDSSQMQHAIIESEEKYRTVVENASEGIFIIQDGYVVFANQIVIDILGYNSEELSQSHFIELIHEDDRALVIQNHKKRLEGKKFSIYHSRVKTKSGNYITVEVNATKYTYNGRPATLNFTNDITEKLRYETELKENEARYHSFFSNSIEAISIFSTETMMFIDVNDSFCKMYGYTKEEALLLSVKDVSAEAEISEKAVKESEESGGVNIPVRYHKKKDGTIMVVSISAGPFIWKGRKVMYSILRDVTEEKKIKQTLAENEERLNLAIETSKIGFYDWDSTSGKIYYDENWMTALGYEHYELEHSIETWQNLLHPDDKDRVLNKLDLLLEGEVPFIEVEQRLRKKDGDWIWIFERAKVIIRDEDGKPLRIMGTHLDINKRKLDEEEIRKNQRYLNNIMDNSPAYIAYVDAESLSYQFVNNKFLKTYGFTKEEFKKKNAQDILGESNFQFALPYINKAREGNISSYENCIVTAVDGKKWINVNFIPDFDSLGEVVGIFVFTYDITEIKNNEEKVKEHNKALAELNVSKDKFFSIISHDLRGPFNSMLGFSELLISRNDEFDSQQKLEYLNHLHESIQHSYDLLENLLLWALSQKGGIEFNPKRLNLNSISLKLINLLKQSSQKKSIKISVQVPEDIYMMADENMLSTIIRNLISNAIKFTPKGGEIILKADLKINENNQKCIEILIKDNGVGMSKDIQSKLFKISETASAYGTENETGTGLGLILCQEFVQYHKGTIWVSSELGKGSEFKFSIPL
jgi:PAS domain S-box-containing protein